MSQGDFLKALQEEVSTFADIVATADGEWIIKGFIDIHKRIYSISLDTKVISKALELLLIPRLITFGAQHGYQAILAAEQNFYPDISFVSIESNETFAVDIKSTYRTGRNSKGIEMVNGMTLGAFTGYFRNRTSTKNITFPYGDYSDHIVLGTIYTQIPEQPGQKQMFHLDELEAIGSVITDFAFFAQPKYRIASSRPGSGNTKNIGSVIRVDQLLSGNGPFAQLDLEIFDDYWMYYLTKDMANALEVPRPYTDLATYIEYKRQGSTIPISVVESLDQEETRASDESREVASEDIDPSD